MRRYTIKNFNEQFPADDDCLEFLKNARWPEGIECPNCKRITKHYRIAERKVYSCEFCGNQVSPTADTIFHKSRTSLRSWFYAIYLMASTRTGISAKQLERELGVTYKTAWRMFKEIRKLMAENANPLSGEVEADDAYFGGRRRGVRGRGAKGKQPAVGMAQRKGRIIARVSPDVKAKTVLPTIRKHVLPMTKLYTDEFPSYDRIGRFGYKHHRIQHSAKVYAIGDVHTNTIEGFWSLVKRGIDGVHHVVSHKYLQNYLDSYTFRWNHRNNEEPMFSLLLAQISASVCE